MGFEFDTQSILESLATQLATLIPLALTELDGLGAPTIKPPEAVVVVDDIDEPIAGRRPQVAIMEGVAPEVQDYLTPHRDLIIPLEITVTMEFFQEDAKALSHTRYFQRAIDMALTRISYQRLITGVFHIDVDSSPKPEKVRDDNSARWARRGVVEATLYARTERAQT
jgi:hypothetical protein